MERCTERVGVMDIENQINAGGVTDKLKSFCCDAPVRITVSFRLQIITAECIKCGLVLGSCTAEQLYQDFGLNINQMKWDPRERPKF